MSSDNYQDKEFDFQQVFYFFKRHYSKIAIFTVISILIGCFLVLSTNPVYSSNSKILIEKTDDDGFGFGVIEGSDMYITGQDVFSKYRCS